MCEDSRLAARGGGLLPALTAALAREMPSRTAAAVAPVVAAPAAATAAASRKRALPPPLLPRGVAGSGGGWFLNIPPHFCMPAPGNRGCFFISLFFRLP